MGTEQSLQSLYGSGTGLSTVDPKSKTWEPLLMAIEQSILRFCKDQRPIPTGGSILLTVKDLGMSPESPTVDALGKAIQQALRDFLKDHNYSRQDLKMALRIVARSVDMHTNDGGIHGYLTFIKQFVAV